jgi:micrococcal nuclease
LLSLLAAGCPRPVAKDDAGPRVDAFFPGNDFESPVVFDDARVRDLDPSTLEQGPSPCREPVLARVYRITDGDTIWVRGEDVVLDVSVRMIGIDTPEIAHSGDPADCYGDEAQDFTAQLDGRLVWLTFDAECFDPYDRLLAYVYVGATGGDLWERQLLRRGFARVLTVGDNDSFAGTFESDEEVAVESDAGLWSACF